MTTTIDTPARTDIVSHSPTPFLQQPVEVRCETCQKWWDIFASYTLMLDAAGWPSSKIAEAMGMPVADVDAIPNPQPPQNDFSEGWRRPLEMARVYASAVAELLAVPLRRAYYSAQDKAEREGFSRVVFVLQALEDKHKRLHASLDGTAAALSL
jgi:hypothetical protein